jgi:hypothetical protein
VAGRSDVDALSRSFRSRILLLALLLVIGIAAAVWTGTRETGIGAPEDRRRIIVVTADSGIDYYDVLELGGFDIYVDELDDWLSTARAAAPESEVEGVALVLEHADRQGFALVVFEQPSALDWGELELEPPLDSIDRLSERDYAAVSVGDFAFPHRLSVDDPGDDPILRLPGYGALQAVFRQELISARETLERPTVAELQFEDAIKRAREMFERPAEFAATIAQAQASVEAELADGSGARTLLPMLATGTAMPTPDGGILLFHHELVLFSDNARTLELEVPTHMQLSWISPAAVSEGLETGAFEREPCTSLAGGALVMSEQPRIEAAADGSAVAIESPEGGAVVWRKREGQGCEWDSIAELDRVEGIVLAPRLPGADGPERSLAARVEQIGDASRVLVWTLGEGGLLDLHRVIQQTSHQFTAVAFVDDRHLAVTAVVDAGQPPEDRVYLLDRTRPDLYLSVPLEFFASGRRLRDVVALAPASDARGPDLLVTAQNVEGRLELIRVRVAADAWSELAATQPEPLAFGVEATMVSLTPTQLETELLTEAESLLGIDARPGALIVAAANGPRPAELTLFELETGDRRPLTDNWIRDYIPRLAGDGGYVTFVSLMRMSLAPEPFSVPRVLVLGAKK